MIDLYAIVSIFVLIVLCAWHAIIGTFIFIDGQYQELDPNSKWTWVDRRLFIVLASLYIIIHVAMGIWHYLVPIGQRREMRKLDQRYRKIVQDNLSRDESNFNENIV